MAKEQRPVAQLSGIAERTIEQGRDAVDMYFDTLKRTISSYPTGGTEFGEKLKSYAETNISTTHEFVNKRKASPTHTLKRRQVSSKSPLRECREPKHSALCPASNPTLALSPIAVRTRCFEQARSTRLLVGHE
jgi:hypothetical protein